MLEIFYPTKAQWDLANYQVLGYVQVNISMSNFKVKTSQSVYHLRTSLI